MADNTTTGTGVAVATRSVTYSGDAAQNAQVVGLVAFSGADDAKTANDLPGDATNGLDVDVTRVPADPFGANADAASATGSISAKLRQIAATGVAVTAVPSDPFGANADAASATGSLSAKLRLVAGTVGTHDSPEGTTLLMNGGSAAAGLAGATMVADNDATNFHAGIDGVQIVRPHCPLEDIVTGNASNTDGTSFSVIAAGAAGVKHYLTQVTITNTSTSSIFCEIKDGTTAKWTIPVPAQGGATVSFTVPIPGTAATAWNCDPSAATTTVYCSMAAFKSKI